MNAQSAYFCRICAPSFAPVTSRGRLSEAQVLWAEPMIPSIQQMTKTAVLATELTLTVRVLTHLRSTCC